MKSHWTSEQFSSRIWNNIIMVQKVFFIDIRTNQVQIDWNAILAVGTELVKLKGVNLLPYPNSNDDKFLQTSLSVIWGGSKLSLFLENVKERIQKIVNLQITYF